MISKSLYVVLLGDDDNSYYGGVIFGFNENNVRIWVPSKNDGVKHIHS